MGEGSSNECHNTQETFDLDSSALGQLLYEVVICLYARFPKSSEFILRRAHGRCFGSRKEKDYLSTFLSNAASLAAFSWQREASHFVRC